MTACAELVLYPVAPCHLAYCNIEVSYSRGPRLCPPPWMQPRALSSLQDVPPTRRDAVRRVPTYAPRISRGVDIPGGALL